LFKNKLDKELQVCYSFRETFIQGKEGAGRDSAVELSLQNKHATNPIINNETNDNRAVAQGDGLGRGSEPYDCWCNHNDRSDGRTTHVEQAVEFGLVVIAALRTTTTKKKKLVTDLCKS
jgi:hypothetical protein